MLVLGTASNLWEMFSSLQATSASAPAANIGVGSFTTENATSPATAGAGGLQSVAPPTGTTGRASLSPDVLGFLIWNQSQQPSTSPSASGASANATSGTNGAAGAATGTNGATGTSAISASGPWQSWFSQLASAGDGIIAPSACGAGLGANGIPSTGATPPNQSSTPGSGLTLAGDPGTAAPESSGLHGHHHHHAGFASQSQSNPSNQSQSSPSDPLASLLGSSVQGASSTTATNANGSTTTTITYADGSEVTLTTPPQASSGNPASVAALPPSINSNNFLETLIQMQARLVAPTSAA